MRPVNRASGAAGTLALILAMLAAGPAAAAGDTANGTGGRPDGSIRFKAYQSPFGTYRDLSPWNGRDVYNTTGRRQTATLRAIGAYERGTHLVFTVAIRNDGRADRFAVKASGTGSWPVRYFARGADITAAVVAGTYLTGRLANDERAFIKVKVRLGRPGTALERRLTLTAVDDPARQDAVRLRVSYSGCSC